MATIESVTRSKQWPIWVGSSADFQRLLRRIENHCESLLPAHIAEKTKYARERLASCENRHAELLKEPLYNYPNAEVERDERLARMSQEIESAKERLGDEEREASEAGRIRLTLTGDKNERRTVIGTAQEIVDDLDGRPVKVAEFEAPSGHIPMHSIMVRADVSEGLYVRLSSADSHWCVAGFAELEDEINRQLPRWRFVRAAKFLTPLYFITFMSAFTLLGNAWRWYPREEGKLTSDALWNFAMIYLLAVPGFTVLATQLTQRFISAFEIVPGGKRHRGQALIAVVGSCIATVTLGILVNLISQPLTGN